MPFPVFGETWRTIGAPLGSAAPEFIYAQTLLNTDRANLIDYWPLGELSGTAAVDSAGTANGVYTGTVTLGQPGLPDGSKSVLFGAGARVSLAATLSAINAAMSKTKGTFAAWCKMTNAGIWTDGAAHVVMSLGVDANNRIFIQKTTVNNTLQFNHRGGGTSKSLTPTLSATTWFHLALTWDNTADQFKAYINGVQSGATLTGLGTLTGTLAASFSALGDFTSSGSLPWAGWLAHVAVWKVALTAAQISALVPAPFLLA